jgi:flagellar protein FliO/FliZ
MLAVRVVFSLAVVLLMMWGLSRVLQARGGGGPRTSNLEVVSRATLGKRASVVVVRTGERGLILGVTDQSVSLLGETELPAPASAERRTPVELTPELLPEGQLVAVPDLDIAADAAEAVAPRRARHRAAGRRIAADSSGLSGSVLSPATWRQTAEALREKTART